MNPQELLLLASCVYAAFFVVAVYFTRTPTRRVVGAVAGGVGVAAAGVGVEALCQALGVWRYSWSDTGYGSPLMYPGLALMWATLSLIGWRVMRRFGWRGEAIFLAAVTVLGTLRDYLHAWQAPRSEERRVGKVWRVGG